MAGYKNRYTRLEFPEISEDGDLVWVEMKNPRLIPPADFTNMSDDAKTVVAADGEGSPAGDDADPKAALLASGRIFGRLIRAWHVYDATDDTDDQAVLPLPSADPTVMERLPNEILLRLGEEMERANSPR